MMFLQSSTFAVLLVLGIPALAIVGIWFRLSAKQKVVRQVEERIRASLPGAEWFPDGLFRWEGRRGRISIGPNPLFERRVSIRLSLFCPNLLEAELRDARNVPTKTPQVLASDPFYRSFVLDSPSPAVAAAWFLKAKERIAPLFPKRWASVSLLPCEVVLSGNRETWEDLRGDLKGLAALVDLPAEPVWSGGIWTIREDFEKNPPAWHWKPEQRAALPPGIRRWCVSAWYGTLNVDLPIARLLWRLAGAGPKRIVTSVNDLAFLEAAFGGRAEVVDRTVELDRPEALVAADHWFDGEFMDGFVAGTAGEAFRGAIKLQGLDRAIAALPGWRFFARRLFDDEFSWYSSEYEILSTALTADEVMAAVREEAARYKAEVWEIDRRFSFKLLREDRLEGTREEYEGRRTTAG